MTIRFNITPDCSSLFGFSCAYAGMAASDISALDRRRDCRKVRARITAFILMINTSIDNPDVAGGRLRNGQGGSQDRSEDRKQFQAMESLKGGARGLRFDGNRCS
ncbi:hypothetical protein C043_02756 [Brucella abortus 80/101]|nr:hypothetical protein C043_02756 [Brucella abortus 80/101]